MHNNPILRISTKILFAPIILFGLYVQFHGDFGPGGGFQAGVIVASAFILYSLVFGIGAGKKLFPSKVNLIEFNEIGNLKFKSPQNMWIQKYVEILKANNISVSIRRSRGKDINAACGQLINLNKVG